MSILSKKKTSTLWILLVQGGSYSYKVELTFTIDLFYIPAPKSGTTSLFLFQNRSGLRISLAKLLHMLRLKIDDVLTTREPTLV